MKNIILFFLVLFNPILLFSEVGPLTTTFYVVRHSQTDWNLEKKIQGHSDIPLNEAGKQEAQLLAETIRDISFSICFTLDLKRAYETALILTCNHPMKIPIIVDSRLRERNCGIWEGAPYADFYAAAPNGWHDIESNEEMQSRSIQCLTEIAEAHPGKHILLVTHGGIMRNLILSILALDWPEESIITKNGSVLILERSHDGWRITGMHQISISG